MKHLIYAFLCNAFFGRVLYLLFRNNVPNIRHSFVSINVDTAVISYSNYASLFWGFYEAAEIRLVKKYLSGELNVVELGASIGGVAIHIIKKIKKNNSLICVEANQKLLKTLRTNIEKYNINRAASVIINKAVSYKNEQVLIRPGSNHTETRIIEPGAVSENLQTVQTCRLATIVQELDQYDLVCDIEGTEIEIILKDGAALRKCKNLFIELHIVDRDDGHYSIEQISELIIKLDFQLIERDGNVFYFKNNNQLRAALD